MKNFFIIKTLVLFIFLNSNIKGQTNSLAFTYDAAGNMVQRQLQVIPPPPPCPSCQKLANNNKDSNEVSPPINFKIYPNPAQTYVTIEGKLPENCVEANVQLLSSTGQVLKTDIYNSEIKTINVSDLKNGIYFMEIIYNKKQKSTYKIIVTN